MHYILLGKPPRGPKQQAMNETRTNFYVNFYLQYIIQFFSQFSTLESTQRK